MPHRCAHSPTPGSHQKPKGRTHQQPKGRTPKRGRGHSPEYSDHSKVIIEPTDAARLGPGLLNSESGSRLRPSPRPEPSRAAPRRAEPRPPLLPEVPPRRIPMLGRSGRYNPRTRSWALPLGSGQDPRALHRSVTQTRPLFLFRPLNPAFPDSGKNREEKAEGSEAPPDKYCGPAPPTDLTSAPRQDGGARALPRRLPPGAETQGVLRAAKEVKSGRAWCGATARVRGGASLPRAWPGTWAESEPRALTGWSGESCHVERRDALTGGARGHVGGVPPRVRVSAPSSDFVAPFLPFSQAKCRKETLRASRVLREVPAPSSLGDGGLSGGDRRLHSLQVAFPPSAPGTSPLEESRRYPDGTFLKKSCYLEFRYPGVQLMFSRAYRVPGLVLGLTKLAPRLLLTDSREFAYLQVQILGARC